MEKLATAREGQASARKRFADTRGIRAFLLQHSADNVEHKDTSNKHQAEDEHDNRVTEICRESSGISISSWGENWSRESIAAGPELYPGRRRGNTSLSKDVPLVLGPSNDENKRSPTL